MKIDQQSILKACHRSVVPEADSEMELDSRTYIRECFEDQHLGREDKKGMGKGKFEL